MKKLLFVAILLQCIHSQLHAQAFPNPATLSTGQGPAGNNDPIWVVSPWFTSNPPNPIGLTYIPALINNSCAPGAWVNPATLPPPVNNGNWITGSDGTCASNTNDGYRYFRLTLDLPSDCNGNSVATTGSYTLYLSGYADNTISDVYVNGTSTGINGGNFSSPLSITLTGPWVAGTNYVDVLVYNFSNGGQLNPYGLLLVANSAASSVADGDNDGIVDINDQCPCMAGTLSNGCLPVSIAGDTVICNGDSTTLTATGFGTYVWNTGETGTTITVAPNTYTRYSVVSTASNGYTDSAVVHVTVNSLPTPAINPATQGICSGTSASLTASGGISYSWSTTDATATISVTPANTSTYTVTVTDANTCSATASATVTVNALPIATINPASAILCNGESTTLTASGGTSYIWSNTSTTASITVTPASTTTYTVTATDANTCTASASASVTVNPLPNAAVSPATTAICAGNSTTLNASGGISYVWDANANSANTASVTLTPANTTSYSVTATDANTCSATAGATVAVNQLPIASVNPPQVTICNNTSTTLTASGGATYLWSNAAITATITVSPSANTQYNVTVTDANTCSTTASAAVTVNALPIALITPSSSTICFGNSATLQASGGASYVWSNAAITDSISVSPQSNATYSVTTTDANTCTASATANVTVIPLMVLSATPTNVDCFGGNTGAINLSVSSGQSPYSYLWSTTDITQNIVALTQGTYSVTVTDNAGCTATASSVVNEPAELILTSAFSNPTCASIAPDGNISLTINGGTTPYQYLWDNNANTANLYTLLPGNYSVTVYDAHNCSVTDAFTLSYIYDFSVQANGMATIKLGETAGISYTLNGNAGNYTSLWSPASLVDCSTCQNTTAYTNHTTLYQIKIENDSGCIATDTVTVNVIPDYSLFVPNAFTPNGDGNNDLLMIFGNKNAIEYFSFQIFNRIGEKVFETNNSSFTWDGSYKGTMQQPGVYVWQLKATFNDGHTDDIRKGTLTLIR